MKLFYSTGACSTSCHIAIEEAGLAYTPVEVSWDRNENVAELEALNPLGVAPILVMDDGRVLTQNAAILEYIADKAPEKGLLAAQGTWERVQTISWLSFVASDFHKAFAPLFSASAMATATESQDQIKAFAKTKVVEYLNHLEDKLTGRDYITGQQFTIADTYLFVVLGWCKWMEIDTKSFQNVSSYIKRVYARPAVQKVLKAQDLLEDYL